MADDLSDELADFREVMPGSAAFSNAPRRIGLVIEDVDGTVIAIDCTDLSDADLRIDYPETQAVPLNLSRGEFARALVSAMQRQRVQLVFTAGQWTWRVR